MDTQNLIDMANRIGDFFDSMPDREEAITGVADHIRRFWEPRMRRALLAALDAPQAGGIEMSAIVKFWPTMNSRPFRCASSTS